MLHVLELVRCEARSITAEAPSHGFLQAMIIFEKHLWMKLLVARLTYFLIKYFMFVDNYMHASWDTMHANVLLFVVFDQWHALLCQSLP